MDAVWIPPTKPAASVRPGDAVLEEAQHAESSPLSYRAVRPADGAAGLLVALKCGSGDDATGRRWRAEYLWRTYGAGAYTPYERPVAEAAEAQGLSCALADALRARWAELRPWPEAPGVLGELARRAVLGMVTNCSDGLGRAAAQAFPCLLVVVTAEQAGWYKPRRKPYRLALEELGIPAVQTLFVAGSAYDLPGAASAGMLVYWHIRARLTAPPGVPAPLMEARSLTPLLDVVK